MNERPCGIPACQLANFRWDGVKDDRAPHAEAKGRQGHRPLNPAWPQRRGRFARSKVRTKRSVCGDPLTDRVE
jgi:hypothetical protein